MTLLATGNGIKCDKCGSEHVSSFTYYSFDLIDVPIRGTRPPSDRRKRKVSASHDICEGCMAKYTDLIVKHNTVDLKTNAAKTRCDHCGVLLVGTVKFIKVSKVMVLNGSTNVDEHFVELFFCDKAINELRKPNA